jgi:hypothetical protein
MQFCCKDRYTVKSEFFSLESLIDYLRSQNVVLAVRDKIEFSRTSSTMTYLGDVKFVGCGSYDEALYVHNILESEESVVLDHLRLFSTNSRAKTPEKA